MKTLHFIISSITSISILASLVGFILFGLYALTVSLVWAQAL